MAAPGKKPAQAKARKPAAKAKSTHKASGPKRVNLALQGGGAHGAFTWGVLDRLLEDERIEIEAASGTSAGAMNGAALAYGLISGGRDGAREMLKTFWQRVSQVAAFSPLQPTMFDRMTGSHNVTYSPGFYAMDWFTRTLSPYQYNPLDLNPLRDILDDMIDFEAIRTNKHIKLFINATHVLTGKIKVFKTPEMTRDMVVASACLPHMFQTVVIDGEPYWDGGYSGNPAIYPLFYSCASNDIIIVQINPMEVDTVPTTASEIFDRINEISFNSTLMREMRAIAFVKKLLAQHRVDDRQYKDIRPHLIEAEMKMKNMGAASKYNADWDFLCHLHDVGYEAADRWLAKHFDAIGVKTTVDIDDIYL